MNYNKVGINMMKSDSMKHLPNTISVLRIILSFTLLLTEPLGAAFLIIYSVCGFSDALDGYIARKTGSESPLGEKLDSIADFIMVAILVIMIVPIINLATTIIFWIGVIFFIRVASLLVTYLKFKSITVLHTYGNKVTGFLLFLLPFVFAFAETDVVLYMVCFAATVSAIEELSIHLLAHDLVVNRRSIFDLTDIDVQ